MYTQNGGTGSNFPVRSDVDQKQGKAHRKVQEQQNNTRQGGAAVLLQMAAGQRCRQSTSTNCSNVSNGTSSIRLHSQGAHNMQVSKCA